MNEDGDSIYTFDDFMSEFNAFFDKVTPEELAAEFEEMGYRFIPIGEDVEMDKKQIKQLEKEGIIFKSLPLDDGNKEICEWSFGDYEIVTNWRKSDNKQPGYYSSVRRNGEYFKALPIGKVSIYDAIIETIFGIVSGLEQEIKFKDRHIELLNRHIDNME